MPSPVEQFSRRQFIEFIAIVKLVCLKMFPAVNGPMIRVLEQPSFKASASGIELVYCAKYIQEDTLDRFLGFTIVAQDCTRYSEDQSTMPFK